MLKVATTIKQAVRYADKAASMIPATECVAIEQIGETFYVVRGEGDDSCTVARIYGTFRPTN